MLRMTIGRSARFATMTALCALASGAAAQDMPSAVPPAGPAQSPAQAPQPQQPPQASATAAAQQNAAASPAAPQPGPAAPAANPLNKGQLEQLVAPIALYPDPLLSQVLMASTYPLEIVEADRWVRDPAHQTLKGDALTQALQAMNWDPSVKALVPFPKLLMLMADKLEWTQSIGNAFLAQQADVMNAVQSLRHEAMAAGNLKATPQCHCVIQTSGDNISILPSDTAQVCIPIYNPRVAYGTWSEPDYPPYYFPPPPGFAFEPGYDIGYWPVIEIGAIWPLWGWGWFDWGHRDIAIDGGRFAAVSFGHTSPAGGVWVHDPAHRGGVGYADPAVTGRFGAARVAAVTAAGHASRAGAAASAGRFGGRAAVTAGHFAGAGHFGHASFSAGRAGGAAHFHGAAHFGGGGHFAHANFAHAGGGPHFAGGGAHFGGGGPHFGGGGGGHGGGGGGGGGHHH